jgi:hypothetical protein
MKNKHMIKKEDSMKYLKDDKDPQFIIQRDFILKLLRWDFNQM